MKYLGVLLAVFLLALTIEAAKTGRKSNDEALRMVPGEVSPTLSTEFVQEGVAVESPKPASPKRARQSKTKGKKKTASKSTLFYPGAYIGVNPRKAVGVVGVVFRAGKSNQRYYVTTSEALGYQYGEGVQVINISKWKVIPPQNVVKASKGLELSLVPIDEKDKVLCFVPGVGPLTGTTDDLSCEFEGMSEKKQGCSYFSGKKRVRIPKLALLTSNSEVEEVKKEMEEMDGKQGDPEGIDVVEAAGQMANRQIAFIADKKKLYGDGGAAIVNPVGQVVGIVHEGVSKETPPNANGTSPGLAYRIHEVMTAFPGLELELCIYGEEYNPCDCVKTPKKYLTAEFQSSLSQRNSCNVTLYWNGNEIPHAEKQHAVNVTKSELPWNLRYRLRQSSGVVKSSISTKPQTEVMGLVNMMRERELVVDEFCTLQSIGGRRSQRVKFELNESSNYAWHTLKEIGACDGKLWLQCPRQKI